MQRKSPDFEAPAYQIDGLVYDRQMMGGLMLLLNAAGEAYTVAGEGGRRFPTASDLIGLVQTGKAKPVSPSLRPAPRIMRAVRTAAPSPSMPDPRSLVGGRYNLEHRRDPRRTVDEALTLGAFVHLTDPDTDELDGFGIYLRALTRLHALHRGIELPPVSIRAFRRRIEEVHDALFWTDDTDEAVPRAH